MLQRNLETLGRGFLVELVEQLPDPAFVLCRDGLVHDVNSRLGALTGRSPESLVGRPAVDLLPTAHRASVGPRLAAYLRCPEPRTFAQGLQVPVRHRDGTSSRAAVAMTLLPPPYDALLLVHLRDLGELSLEQIQLRGLLESAPDATLIVDPGGLVRQVNQRAEQMFGHDRTELFGLPVERLVPHWRGILPLDDAGQVAQLDMGSCPPATGRRAGGEEFPLDLGIAPIRTAEGPMSRVALRDVTERVRLRLEAERMKDEFLATVSHELRTPLTAVLGYAELMDDLDDDELGDEARHYLSVIRRSAGRELRLVDDLLTMITISEGDLSIRTNDFDLRDVVRHAVEAAQPQAREADVILRLAPEVGRDADARLYGDADRIGQALDNLISNAIKFTPFDGEVEVQLRAEEDRAVIAVRDSGPGVPEQEMGRMFERLYRGPLAVESQLPGAGLGLAIVKAIVEAHQGAVGCQNGVDGGTVFWLELPLT